MNAGVQDEPRADALEPARGTAWTERHWPNGTRSYECRRHGHHVVVSGPVYGEWSVSIDPLIDRQWFLAGPSLDAAKTAAIDALRHKEARRLEAALNASLRDFADCAIAFLSDDDGAHLLVRVAHAAPEAQAEVRWVNARLLADPERVNNLGAAVCDPVREAAASGTPRLLERVPNWSRPPTTRDCSGLRLLRDLAGASAWVMPAAAAPGRRAAVAFARVRERAPFTAAELNATLERAAPVASCLAGLAALE